MMLKQHRHLDHPVHVFPASIVSQGCTGRCGQCKLSKLPRIRGRLKPEGRRVSEWDGRLSGLSTESLTVSFLRRTHIEDTWAQVQ